MFLDASLVGQAQKRENISIQLPAPVGGLNAVSSIMSMAKTDSVVLENLFPYPDRLELRQGSLDHVTGSGANIDRLHAYSSPTGTDSLWATTDSGVYNVTAAGAIPAAAVALTDGKTIGSILSTGASNYLTLCNGVDTIKQYDGTTWSSIATFGATSTATYSYIETYRQRYYLISRNSMTLEYLAANSITGATVTYNLGSIFRRGGRLVALGTWTIDGGTGPDDQLVICTSQGEIAVFSGTDPASVNTWAFRGVYYIGRPLGPKPFFKYGGDLLYLCENGLFPLSKALLVASLDRTQSVSRKISQIFSDAGKLYFANEGWEIIAAPDIPFVLVNVPGDSIRYQYVMHAQTGSWSIFSGWSARCFARIGSDLYFGTDTTVVKVTGVSDNGDSIVGTMLQAYSNLGFSRGKKIQEIRPLFQSNGSFTYSMGISRDFEEVIDTNSIAGASTGSASLWGSATWGTNVWNGSFNITREWRSVPDDYSTWKAFYLQISSTTAEVKYLGADLLVTEGGSF